MRVFYTPNIDSNALPQEEAQHASRVLRLKTGDKISLVNGSGTNATAEVTEIDKRNCNYKVLSQINENNHVKNLEIAVAPTKSNDRLEWMIEKITEIGIAKIHLIFTSRTEKTKLKEERLFKKVVSAAKQSHKSYFPEIQVHKSYSAFIEGAKQQIKLIAHLADNERVYIGNQLKKECSTLVLIGPEGDFTDEEIALAHQKNFKSVTLGGFRLRTETAAIFTTTILNHNRYS